MQLHLLGYSESFISRLLDSLLLQGHTEMITIVTNMEVEENFSFCPPGIQYKKISHAQWQFDPARHQCIPAVARPGVKQTVVDFFNIHCGVKSEHYVSVIHPAAVVASTVNIGKACFIEPGTVLASFASIGFGCYINRGATIGHHTTLHDFVSVNPGVHIAGHCDIGTGVQVGMGTVVFDRIKIGKNSIIGGGSVVMKDIPDNVIAWGNPCKVIKPIV